jgi:hypothetical protein
VTTVVVFNVDTSSSGRVGLQLSSVLLTPPLGWSLKGLNSLDLPLLGNVGAQDRDLGLLPYVGAVDTIGTLDASNALIQPAPGGFVIRGSVSGGNGRGSDNDSTLVLPGVTVVWTPPRCGTHESRSNN